MKKILLGLFVSVLLLTGVYQVDASPVEETITRTLMEGMKGSDVSYLQTYLGIPSDGYYGPQTVTKVKNWQRQNSILADGMFGPGSLKKLISNQNTGSVLGATADTTPRIMYWSGKINQHVDSNGVWQTDPDENSGADIDKLTYCKKWFPNTISVEPYISETINTWMGGADSITYTNTKVSDKCVQGTVIPTIVTSATITATSCSIQSGSKNCPSNIKWNVMNPKAGSTYKVITANHNNSPATIETVGSGMTGSIYYNVGVMEQVFAIVDSLDLYTNEPLAIAEVTSTCATGTIWNTVSGCVNDQTVNSGVPILVTSIPQQESLPTSMKIGGHVMSNGGSAITSRGIVWGIYPNPTITKNSGYLTAQTNLDSYVVNATGLTPNTYYYIRSYAMNNQGTGYGNELTERTPVAEILTPKIKVTYPNGGELYQAGQKVGVKWNSNIIVNSNDKVSIYLKEYSNNGGYEKIYTMCSNCENSGLADVYIPSLDSRLKKYKVSIRLTTNNGFVTEDESDNLFTVNSSNTTPSITITSPNGGETYKAGQQVTVSWTSNNIPASALVQISSYGTGGNVFGVLLPNGTPNDGVETFTLPKTLPTATYKITINLMYNPTQNSGDSSDNSFTIASSDAVINPSYCSAGMLTQRLWRGTFGVHVKILQTILASLDYLDDKDIDGQFGRGTRSAVMAFQSENNLTPDGYVGTGTMNALNKQWQAKCVGTVVVNPSSIPSITIISPKAGDIYKPGDKITVKWESKNLPYNTGDRVSIMLSHNRGAGIGLDYLGRTSFSNGEDGSTENDGIQEVLISTEAIKGLQINVKNNEKFFGNNFTIKVFSNSKSNPVVGRSNTFSIVNNGSFEENGLQSLDSGCSNSAKYNEHTNELCPKITVTSPNEGSEYKIGDKILFKWNPTTAKYLFIEDFVTKKQYSLGGWYVPSDYGKTGSNSAIAMKPVSEPGVYTWDTTLPISSDGLNFINIYPGKFTINVGDSRMNFNLRDSYSDNDVSFSIKN